ncbi:DEP domain-containing mTOR-interacting protein-like isoform X3 [Mustelus asterias]
MQKLMDHNIIHHVCDGHSEFKDAKLLYRFRKDDGTFPLTKEVKVFIRGQSLYEKKDVKDLHRVETRLTRMVLEMRDSSYMERLEKLWMLPLEHKRLRVIPRLISSEDAIMKLQEENGVKYQRAVFGCEIVDWLIKEGEASSRTDAVELCRRELEHGIIQHVSNRHHFFDGNLLYQFRINFRRRRRLTELLSENSGTAQESHDSPFCLRKLNPEQDSSSFLSVQTNKEIKVVSAVRRSSITSGVAGSTAFYNTSPSLACLPSVECNPKSVLKRPVTNEELLSPGAPYLKKTLTIVGDAVGWGFVVRGGRPCYIQAVDPGGPAAAAGIKVRQFVVSANSRHVMHLDYKTVSNIIMTGPRTLVMEVMEAIE